MYSTYVASPKTIFLCLGLACPATVSVVSSQTPSAWCWKNAIFTGLFVIANWMYSPMANGGAVQASGSSFAEVAGSTALKLITNKHNGAYTYVEAPYGTVRTMGPVNPFFSFSDVALHDILISNDPKGRAEATAESHPQLGRNNDSIVLTPTSAEGSAEAFSWAKAGLKAGWEIRPPENLLAKIGVVGSIKLSAGGADPAVAITLDNLSATTFNRDIQNLFVSAFDGRADRFQERILTDFASIGLPGGRPGIPYLTIFASLNELGELDAYAFDYLGNILLSPSDFVLTMSDGELTASYSGEISTTIIVTAGELLDLNFEYYAGAVGIPGVTSIPEPNSTWLLSLGLLPLVIRRLRARNEAKRAIHCIASKQIKELLFSAGWPVAALLVFGVASNVSYATLVTDYEQDDEHFNYHITETNLSQSAPLASVNLSGLRWEMHLDIAVSRTILGDSVRVLLLDESEQPGSAFARHLVGVPGHSGEGENMNRFEFVLTSVGHNDRTLVARDIPHPPLAGHFDHFEAELLFTKRGAFIDDYEILISGKHTCGSGARSQTAVEAATCQCECALIAEPPYPGLVGFAMLALMNRFRLRRALAMNV